MDVIAVIVQEIFFVSVAFYISYSLLEYSYRVSMSQTDDKSSSVRLELGDCTVLPSEVEDMIISGFLSCSDVLSLGGSVFSYGRNLCHSADIHRVLAFIDCTTRDFQPQLNCTAGYVGMMHTFRWPYQDSEREVRVRSSSTVAYMNFVIDLQTLLASESLVGKDPLRNGVYVEIITFDLDDLISLSLVDFDGGGRASVTFNADMGTVVSEENITPPSADIKVVKGEYCNVLSRAETSSSRSKPGNIAVFVSVTGNVTFYRRRAGVDSWESTNIVNNCLDWVTGRELVTPCVAFGAPGTYKMEIVRVASILPLYAEKAKMPHTEQIKWTAVGWAGFTRTSSDDHDPEEDMESFDTGSDSDRW